MEAPAVIQTSTPQGSSNNIIDSENNNNIGNNINNNANNNIINDNNKPNNINETKNDNNEIDSQALIGNSKFNLKYKDKNYIFIISMTKDKQYIYMKSKEENNFTYYFEIKMTYIELVKLDKIFRTCDDIEDAYNSMLVIFKNEKNYIKEINDNKLIISFFILNLDSSYREKILELTKKSENKDIIIDNLIKQINEIKETKTTLLDELNKIKAENNSLKEIINPIESWKNEVIEEIKELKEKIKIYDFKLFKINSNIIKEEKDYDFIVQRLKKISSETETMNITLYLLYRASIDGDLASDFHSKCDKAKNTLVLVKTKKGLRFGGFTSETWQGNDVDKMDEKAFCFSLDKMKIYNCIKEKRAIFASTYSGPAFENCIFQIKDKCFEEGGECSDDTQNNFDNQEMQYEINNGEENFEVEDVEVFKVIFN